MKVIFFNHWHNGDIHVSRGFVRKIIEKLHSLDPQITFAYSHKNNPNLLIDLPNVEFDPSGVFQIGMHDSFLKKEDTIYINTWYGQQHYKYMNIYGITMDTIYSALNDSCKNIWGFSLEDISSDPKDFFPIIDYSQYHTDLAKKWLSENTTKKVFISNGRALSCRARNFDITAIINKVASNNPNIIFILSNKESQVIAPNIIYSSSIIGKDGSDLNENAFISEHCNVIIGRASGAFSFCINQENMFHRSIKLLCFSNLVPKQNGKFWLDELLSNRINYSSNIITTNESDPNNIQKIIEEHL